MKAAVWEDSRLSLLRGVCYEEMTELLRGQAMPFGLVADSGKGLQTYRVAVNVISKRSRTADKGWHCGLRIFNKGYQTCRLKSC